MKFTTQKNIFPSISSFPIFLKPAAQDQEILRQNKTKTEILITLIHVQWKKTKHKKPEGSYFLTMTDVGWVELAHHWKYSSASNYMKLIEMIAQYREFQRSGAIKAHTFLPA